MDVQQYRDESPINHPTHYTSGNIECWDAMREAMPAEAFHGYLWGNCFKYIWRWKNKNQLQDLKKCREYLNKLINELESTE